MYNITQNGNHIQQGIKEFAADAVSDIESAPTEGIAIGSEIFCIENSKRYVLSSEKVWKEKA